MNGGTIAYLGCGILIGLFVVLAIIFSIRFRNIERGCWASLIMIMTIVVVLGNLFFVVCWLQWNTTNPVTAILNVCITILCSLLAYMCVVSGVYVIVAWKK
ncbi:hypothetical protein LMB49_10710 [Limosilactobacillus reuteri]|uniref:hypothetical protein n=1 Tax=Limosilactobacillus reuteri TaxID=1598 RepID=UPI001E3B1A7B|nr:hypothetical protein [Limosilactobacillus reuteri]MCC4370568.1 hypothetical protein [Limosilactobacillus reuteri]MCC4371863.1 hypothetical protein [Limosilactobacillus reuteri]MCC4509334.1 hypothetical protein [Limosilactobacillus reuteri]MCC4509377.1 hypothetical protein [Limosilactobacillus reuteri]